MENMSRAVFLLLCLCQLTGGAKILVIPFYHYSHVNLFSVAGKALADSNHDVTVFVNQNFEKTPQKMGLKRLVYKIPQGMAFSDKLAEFSKIKHWGIKVVYQSITEILPSFGKICEHILSDEKLMATIKNHDFDLIIIDGVPIVNCLYTIPYKYDIPYMTLNAALDPWSAGVTGLPSIEPLQISQSHNQMTFFERLKTFIAYTAIYYLPQFAMGGSYYTEKYAPEKPSIRGHQLYRNSAAFLVNHDVTCVDYPRVSAPNYIFIGGGSARTPQPLPEDIKAFVEGAEHGIIIMSFGSLKAWQDLWTTMKPKMKNVFSRVKQRALLLYAFDDNEDFPPNVKAMKWLPQNDLLGHPKAKLFITHGGNNGQLEASYHGVPMLVIPIVGDQYYSGVRVQHRGYGRVLIQGIDTPEEEIYEAMNDVLSNETYDKNIKKCAAIIKSQPSSHEKIAFWVNHVLKFGGDHLRLPSVDMSLFQVLMVDMMLFLLVVFLLQLCCCIFCCRFMYRKCCRSKTKDKTE